MFFGNIINEYDKYRELRKECQNGNTPVSVAGISESAQSVIIYALTADLERKGLVLAYNDIEAKRMADELEFFGVKSVYFPSKEYTFYDVDAKGHNSENERIAALYKILNEKDAVAVASLEAVCGYTVSAGIFNRYFRTIKVGDTVDTSELERDLVIMGYTREDIVEGVGQFSMRGGIFDIFCPFMENPVRIEFFGDEVDSVREFDFVTQLSMQQINSTDITVCSEAVFDNEKCADIVAALKKRLNKKSIAENTAEMLRRDISNFEEKHNFAAADKYAYMIYDKIPTVLDYLPQDSIVFIAEPKRISEISNTLDWEHGEMLLDMSEKGIIFDAKMPFKASYGDITADISRRVAVSFKSLSHTSDDFAYKSLITFVTKTTVSMHGNIDYLFSDLAEWKKKNGTVVLLASNRAKGENLEKVLSGRGFESRYIHDRKEFQKGEFVIIRGSLHKGFEYPDIGLVLISD
ncbi:MAG: hypothetical protein J1F64_05535, partial [Oscillospiraceae bacterium]|nr:hypothetical protein [Oscillospiraceae bacterium]